MGAPIALSRTGVEGFSGEAGDNPETRLDCIGCQYGLKGGSSIHWRGCYEIVHSLFNRTASDGIDRMQQGKEIEPTRNRKAGT